jgi:hypothetical protein
LEETVKVVTKGIKAIAKMSKHWQQFLKFFDEMSARVKIVLGEPMDAFLQYSRTTLDMQAHSRANFLKTVGQDVLFGTVYEAGTSAYLVQYQAAIYKQLSDEQLMPMIISYGELIALDPIQDKMKIANYTTHLEKMAIDSQNRVKEIIQANEVRFNEKVTKRIQNLQTTFDKLVPKLETKKQQNFDRLIEQAKADTAPVARVTTEIATTVEYDWNNYT